MIYELIDKIKKRVVRVEGRPCPCDYCNYGYGNTYCQPIDIRSCQKNCDKYRRWLEGAIVIPENFDEIREVKNANYCSNHYSSVETEFWSTN